MHPKLQTTLLKSVGALAIKSKQKMQSLWSGYGEIARITFNGDHIPNVVIKHIDLAPKTAHPRGWNTDIGHQRKIKSYEVETVFYQDYAHLCQARLPQCLVVDTADKEVLIVLEDLDRAGYPLRKNTLRWPDIERCLLWLAQFHASFLGTKPNNLWEVGTYWHLATRPNELEALTDFPLKKAASKIDQKLNSGRFQTLVHGDAKLANFCFGKDGQVAAVDFQYVGGGCGMKDVAYFIGSCLNEQDCERLEDQILDTYFNYLQAELAEPNKEVETEWRSLYRVAWADFHRFLKGWSPSHWKINSYSERICREVIMSL